MANDDSLGYESSLSSWAGPYVTDMLGRGRAVASQPYQSYSGPLTAGGGDLQQQAFTSAGNFGDPTSEPGVGNMGTAGFTGNTFTSDTGQTTDAMTGLNTLPGIAGTYMNPYLESALQPQIDEMRRDSQISRLGDAARLTEAGAYGGSRQAIMDSETNRNLLQGIAQLRGTAYSDAFDKGRQQYNVDQERAYNRQELINRYGFDVIGEQERLGGTQRGITSEGIAADMGQFAEERDFPYKQAQYMQSLLQELPLEAQTTAQIVPNAVTEGISSATGILGLLGQFGLFGSDKTAATTATTAGTS